MEKWLRIFSLILADIVMCILSATISIFMFGAMWIMISPYFYLIILSVALITVLSNAAFRLYNSLWEFVGFTEILFTIAAVFVANAALFAISYFTNSGIYFRIHLLYAIFSAASVIGIRAAYRFARIYKNSVGKRKNVQSIKRILLVGAGAAGSMIIKELLSNPSLGQPVCVVDDDKSKHGQYIRGFKIEGGRNDIPDICMQKDIDEIIIAVPSAKKKEIRELVAICSVTNCKVKIVSGMYETLEKNELITYGNIKDVQLEDLLGREPSKIDYKDISDHVRNKTILVTGGGGSIGSELCRLLAKFKPEKLLILDIYENDAYDLRNELLRIHTDIEVSIIIASVRDAKRIKNIICKYKPHIVFHAAAHKHVPICEENMGETIKNNVFGTLNVARAAHECNVNRFVLISTDKAVNPTNMMGASKRVCELIVKAYSSISQTIFASVRFGNVLGSKGSVIPLFKKQIEQGLPITVTHPDIIRYFMLIPEAAKLVLQAGAHAVGGEIFVLDMGSPVKIDDLARELIRLSGKEPDVDIKIEYTGLRPGEKLFEELLMSEEQGSATLSDGIFIGNQEEVDFEKLMRKLDELKLYVDDDENAAADIICELVPSYIMDEKY